MVDSGLAHATDLGIPEATGEESSDECDQKLGSLSCSDGVANSDTVSFSMC